MGTYAAVFIRQLFRRHRPARAASRRRVARRRTPGLRPVGVPDSKPRSHGEPGRRAGGCLEWADRFGIDTGEPHQCGPICGRTAIGPHSAAMPVGAARIRSPQVSGICRLRKRRGVGEGPHIGQTRGRAGVVHVRFGGDLPTPHSAPGANLGRRLGWREGCQKLDPAIDAAPARERVRPGVAMPGQRRGPPRPCHRQHRGRALFHLRMDLATGAARMSTWPPSRALSAGAPLWNGTPVAFALASTLNTYSATMRADDPP